MVVNEQRRTVVFGEPRDGNSSDAQFVAAKLKVTVSDSISRRLRHADNRPLLVAIAPGAFYKEHPETGGDGRALIELSKHQRDWTCQRI